MLELIATLRCLLACVVCVQLWTPEYKALALYVENYTINRGVVGGVLSHFGKGGSCGLYGLECVGCGDDDRDSRTCMYAIIVVLCWRVR